ncbi:MAG TPA: Gfo/Idh/MocA family oxidoreductase [Atribacteraceae bacterium]|nr:Gfo/Idh/MocA family oxidoreductase [Atribacteraceae bacterium]
MGYGFIGRIHALAFSSLPYYYGELPAIPQIRGICTSRESTARRAQEESGVSFVTWRVEELLDREDIAIVVVASPNAFHREVVELAARAGKAIYCDKPLAMNSREAVSMREVVEETAVPFGMAFQYRFVPAILRARQLIEAGFLGEVYRVRVSYLHAGYNDPDRPISWRLRKELSGGGALADLGSHAVDLVRYLVGEIRVVAARGRTFIKTRPVHDQSRERVPVQVDDWSFVSFEADEGIEGTLEASRFATGSCDDLRLEIEGMKGAVHYHSMQPNFLKVFDVRKPAGPYGGERGFQSIETVQQYPPPNRIPGKFAVGWVRFHVACAHDFLLRYFGRDASGATIEDGVRVQEFLDDAYRLMGY